MSAANETLTNPFDAIEQEATRAVLRGIGRAYQIVFAPRSAAPPVEREEADALMFPPLPAIEDRPRTRKEKQ